MMRCAATLSFADATAIDVEYWEQKDLEQIAELGFPQLNADLAPIVVQQMAAEAFGSPRLMQAICLNLCYECDLTQPLPEHRRVEITTEVIKKVFERTSSLTDFSSMLSTLHAGPKLRGTERKEFTFNDGTKGDVYRCVLLALKADPPCLSFPYDEIMKRAQVICESDRPAGSSIVQALGQIDALAASLQKSRVIAWDENILEIVEPYFLFLLRSSSYLAKLAKTGSRCQTNDLFDTNRSN
jgi:hypothetical protein